MPAVPIQMRAIVLRLEVPNDQYEGTLRTALESDQFWDAWIAAFVNEIPDLEATVVGHQWELHFTEPLYSEGRPTYRVVDAGLVGQPPDGMLEG